jgi:hypothetical protein
MRMANPEGKRSGRTERDPASETERRTPKPRPARQSRKSHAAIELLRSWAEEGDEEEQRETFGYLKMALDENSSVRTSGAVSSDWTR